MIGQNFFNEVRASFNLRKPKSDRPTNIYLVCRIDRDVDISQFDLNKNEIDFLNRSMDNFEVGTPSLKVRKILNRLLELGIVVQT